MCHTCTRRIYCTAVSPSSDSSPVTRTSPPRPRPLLESRPARVHPASSVTRRPRSPVLSATSLARTDTHTHATTQTSHTHAHVHTCSRARRARAHSARRHRHLPRGLYWSSLARFCKTRPERSELRPGAKVMHSAGGGYSERFGKCAGWVLAHRSTFRLKALRQGSTDGDNAGSARGEHPRCRCVGSGSPPRRPSPCPQGPPEPPPERSSAVAVGSGSPPCRPSSCPQDPPEPPSEGAGCVQHALADVCPEKTNGTRCASGQGLGQAAAVPRAQPHRTRVGQA
jgi:hypothetical protein